MQQRDSIRVLPHCSPERFTIPATQTPVAGMTTVVLLITEPGRLTTEVGRIAFYGVPVQKEDDFHCTPRNIVSFRDAQAISLQLAESPPVVQGRVGRYEWRASLSRSC